MADERAINSGDLAVTSDQPISHAGSERGAASGGGGSAQEYPAIDPGHGSRFLPCWGDEHERRLAGSNAASDPDRS
jgi:hypothetical protein